MKRLPLTLLALLLLAACGAHPAPTQTPPQDTSSSPTPAPTPARWWSDIDSTQLPVQTGINADLNGVPCRLVGSVDGQDIALYCGMDEEEGGWLLRYGTHVDYFPAPISAPPETPPRLTWADFDGDGSEELAVLFYNTPQAADLHVYEWDDGWTDLFFDAACYEPQLNDLLRWHISDKQVNLFCGTAAIHYTLGPDDTGRVAPLSHFDDLRFYRIQDTSITAVFGTGIQVDDHPRYIADLSAQVLYDGSTFSLANPVLNETTGV